MFLLQNLQYTLSQSQHASLILDTQFPGFEILYANEFFLRFPHFNHRNLVGKSFFDVFGLHENCFQNINTKNQILLNTGLLAGSVAETYPILHENGEIACLIFSIHNHQQLTLKHVNPLFADYPDAILTLDLQGNILSFNKVLAELAECSAEELLKQSFYPFILPEDFDLVMSYSKMAILGDIQNFDARIITAKGNRRVINVTFLPVIVDHQVNSVYLIIKDITLHKEVELKLEAYHKQVSDILESITDGFFAVDASWKISYWNKQAEMILNRPREEVMGNNLWEMFPQAIPLKFYENYQRAMRERVSLRFEEYFYVAEIWLDVTVYPAGDGISVYFKDITQQKHDYEAMNEAKEKYQYLFDMNPLPNLVFDFDTFQILDVNQALIDSYGYSREEFLSMNLRELRPEEDVDAFEEIMDKEVQSTGPHQIITRHRKKSGELIDVEVKGNSIMFKGIMARISLLIDVTEKLALERRKHQDEQKLRDSVDRYQILSKATSDAIFDWDAKNDRLVWGEGFKTLFGYEPREDYCFNDWNSLLSPDDRQRINENMAFSIKNKVAKLQHEYRFRCADGTYKFVMDKEFLVYNEQGELTRVIGSMQDITDRINYIKAIEATNERLREISWMQSHVVRAPLARLMGLSDLLNREEMDPAKNEILTKMLDSATELDHIIKQIIKKSENI